MGELSLNQSPIESNPDRSDENKNRKGRGVVYLYSLGHLFISARLGSCADTELGRCMNE